MDLTSDNWDLYDNSNGNDYFTKEISTENTDWIVILEKEIEKELEINRYICVKDLFGKLKKYKILHKITMHTMQTSAIIWKVKTINRLL